jgi:hypothetical protein
MRDRIRHRSRGDWGQAAVLRLAFAASALLVLWERDPQAIHLPPADAVLGYHRTRGSLRRRPYYGERYATITEPLPG